MQWSDETLKTLAAAVDRIIPPDEFPGAWEAGAGEYIRRILTGDLADRAAEFTSGLQTLEATAQSTFGKPFALLDASDQDAILQTIETSGFFRLLVELTSEGYYSDPDSGGNRGMISWKMVGFDPKR